MRASKVDGPKSSDPNWHEDDVLLFSNGGSDDNHGNPIASQRRDVVLEPLDASLFSNPTFYGWIEDSCESYKKSSLLEQMAIARQLIARVKDHDMKFLDEFETEISDETAMLGVAQLLQTCAPKKKAPPSPKKKNNDQLQFSGEFCLYLVPRVLDDQNVKHLAATERKLRKQKRVAGLLAPVGLAKKPKNRQDNIGVPVALAKKRNNHEETTRLVSQKTSDSAAPTTASGGVERAKKVALPIDDDATPSELAERIRNMISTLKVNKIPKGVTARPSGRWQAQLFFGGQSRYIGVFDTADHAAIAYECVVLLLRGTSTKRYGFMTDSKEEARKLFDTARVAVIKQVWKLPRGKTFFEHKHSPST